MITEESPQLPIQQAISPFKKALIVFLTFSEVGLAPFLANAIVETTTITEELANHDLPLESKLAIGYSFATPYVLSAMLSIGDLEKTVRYLFDSDSEKHEINALFKWFHRVMIGSSFLLGSTAAGIGVIQNWGNSYPYYVFAVYAVAGQMSVVMLQANKRIMGSAQSVSDFLISENKKEMMIVIMKKPMAVMNTLLNTLYWGAFYYYLGANISHLVHAETNSTEIISASSAILGGYMAFFTQGVDELKNSYRQIISSEHTEKLSFSGKSRYLTLPLISGSFCCRTLATVSFAYTCFNGQSISHSEFNKALGIAALAMVLPAALPAAQYVKYISQQVDQAIKGIGSNLNRCFSWFKSKKSSVLEQEQAHLLNGIQ